MSPCLVLRTYHAERFTMLELVEIIMLFTLLLRFLELCELCTAAADSMRYCNNISHFFTELDEEEYEGVVFVLKQQDIKKVNTHT